jgi:hypothetical protein
MRAFALLALAALVVPAPAAAHGLSVRSDLPIPAWLFGWGAAVVLVVSFVALAVLWPKPKLEGSSWRPLPASVSRVLTNPALDVLCGAFGVFLLGVLVWSGLVGAQNTLENVTPTFVYVIFWLGLVPASVLFGDVFRAFNPWRALGRATSWVAGRLVGEAPSPFAYPDWLGRWPAAAGLIGFAWMELVYRNGVVPNDLAVAALVYTAVTALGMLLYGVDVWIERAEAFSVYFGLFARISVFERRGDELGLRKPLSGLAALPRLPGTVAVVTVMIGAVTYDGASEGSFWQNIAIELEEAFSFAGFDGAAELTGSIGLLFALLVIGGFFQLGLLGAERAGGRRETDLASAFAHSLVPIALAYVAAHYFTLLLYQGQALGYLSSDPAGKGWDLFGTARLGVDYGLLGSNSIWYLQVLFVVVGHVAALVLAHDRALVLYERARVATQSQYWMLSVMIGFTSLALWLLSESNA